MPLSCCTADEEFVIVADVLVIATHNQVIVGGLRRAAPATGWHTGLAAPNAIPARLVTFEQPPPARVF